jgi:orotate phosphoribosyltransferase
VRRRGRVELGRLLASAVSLVSHQRGRDLPALYAQGAQGSRQRQARGGDKALFPASAWCCFEDVITTGGLSLRAVRTLESAGAGVGTPRSWTDWEARRGNHEAGLPLVSPTTRRDSSRRAEMRGRRTVTLLCRWELRAPRARPTTKIRTSPCLSKRSKLG